MKYFKIAIPIKNSQGEILTTVIGKGLGLLAVTRVIDKREDITISRRKYRITHIPTGNTVSRVYDSQNEALELLPKWAEAADWDFYTTDFASEPKIEQSYRAVRAAGLR